MALFRDQIGREIKIEGRVERIVSTVPSITELIVDLGARDRLLGLTSWCIHPSGLREEKTVIGGTKNLDIEKIRSLKPDLIIANKEENPKEQIEALAKDFPVWVSDVRDVDQAFEMLKLIAELIQAEEAGLKMIENFTKLRKQINAQENLSFLYFIWKDPWMVASSDTYISALLAESGLKNLAPIDEGRYPTLSMENIVELNPDRIILSSEPYAFKSLDLQEFHALGLKSFLVNGEYFTWYGSRLGKSLDYLRKNPFSF